MTFRKALVTGAAGFIGSHLIDKLLSETGDTWHVTGIDNFDSFYSPALKRANVSDWPPDRFTLVEADICDVPTMQAHLDGDYEVIVHLAAKAGVRPSILDPAGYEAVNLRGLGNLLDIAKERKIPQVVFASSSSVYGVNPNIPWVEDEAALRPISPYAATKASAELLGHVYSRVYGIRFLALRFFNVYGPRQRPDSAVHKFARAILDASPLPVFGDGESRRDYVYVEDIVAGIRSAIEYHGSLFEAINLGSNRVKSVMELIRELEGALGKRAQIEWHPEQPGEVRQTCGNMSKARRMLGYEPQIDLEKGLRSFAAWIRG